MCRKSSCQVTNHFHFVHLCCGFQPHFTQLSVVERGTLSPSLLKYFFSCFWKIWFSSFGYHFESLLVPQSSLTSKHWNVIQGSIFLHLILDDLNQSSFKYNLYAKDTHIYMSSQIILLKYTRKSNCLLVTKYMWFCPLLIQVSWYYASQNSLNLYDSKLGLVLRETCEI